MKILPFFALCVSAYAAQVPYLRTSVGPIALPEVQKQTTAADRQGTLSTKGTVVDYAFSGGRLTGNRLSFASLAFSAHFEELTLTTSKVVPVIKISTVKKEKIVLGKRVVYDEPVQVSAEEPRPIRSSHQNVKISAFTKPGAGFSVLLPERVSIRLSSDGTVHIKDRPALTQAFADAVERLLGDEAFWNGVEIRTENLPGIVDLVLAQRDLWRKPLVDALKNEVTKEALLGSLEKSLSEQMPPLQLGGKDLDAEIGLSPDGFVDLALGRATLGRSLTRGYRFQAETDSGGLTLALRAYLSMLLGGRASLGEVTVDAGPKLALLPLKEGDRAAAAQLLTDLGLGRFEAANLSGLALDLSGRHRPVAEITTDEISVTLPFAALSVHAGVAPFPFALRFHLKTEHDRLVVLGLVAATPGKVEGTLWERLQATVRLLAVNAVANREASKLQDGAPELRWQTAAGDEPHLLFTHQ